ncbi:ribokinase [Clostridium sp.]|uniref:ribokinase n=1 Tax=Clostridium sp. TaxID=1506 RepID=UPI00262126E1|nr:ribokinase [Clostridium sp.]
MNKVCVLGSMNMDLVLEINNLPKVGETILSKSFKKISGGKGANQAVAAKRSGADVMMISKIGIDENGKVLKAKLEDDNIDVKFVFEDKEKETGMAIIMVNENGNNSIVVVAGANIEIKQEEIEASIEAIKKGDILISQFETPEDMTLVAFKKAKELGKLTILNPAPAKKIDKNLLKVTDIIVPNETEAEILTGIKVSNLEEAKKAGEAFLAYGVTFAIITLGSKGAAVIGKDFCELVPAYKVNAVDTTAAGDSFIGGLSAKLDLNNINKESLLKAVNFGNRVSSLAVQKKGAQTSIPYLKEVVEIYGED